ncbi:MAG: undecaprenyl-phosphate glucose phosphotransferase [Clostridia bacterium]|nr:undecaprenyl-phosphate glucose phosphotransferase [Clostridia bacterium]
MPSGKRSLLSMIESYMDMIINAVSVYVAFILACLFSGDPPFEITEPEALIAIFAVIIVSSFMYHVTDNYRPTIYTLPRKSYWNIIKANVMAFALIMIWIAFFGKEGMRTFESFWALIHLVLSSALLISKRKIMFMTLRLLRKGQYILKRTLIIGDNTASVKEYVTEIANNPESGVMILGYVGDKIDPDVGCDNLGSFKDLVKVLDRYRPTEVVFAIDAYDKRHLIKLVNICDDRCIKVYFLPVTYGYFKNIRQIEQVGSIPVINIHATPLNSLVNLAVKRAMDIIGSLALILVTSPIMIMAAIGVKLSSEGPVFFKQKRVGKMGKPFLMLKFRSMPVNKNTETNWSAPGDARPTKFGSFIRRTAIDELPQFFNVLMGHMSLVGPRPEMPKYVEKFRDTVPLYMIKHYVKPGITGLAQIKGLRGDTSLEERIQKDIYYIENWSIWLDIGILIKTPFKAFNKYEQYVEKPEDKQNSLMNKIGAKLGYIETGERTKNRNQKILYAASTAGHLYDFHIPYIEGLRSEGHTVMTMARGEGVDYNIPFEKKMFSKQNKLCRRMIREIVEREKFDVIILNTSLVAFHIRYALKQRHRPRTVNIVHGYLFSESPKGFKTKIKSTMLSMAEKLLRPKTDAILTMNDEDLRIATKKGLARGAIIPTFGMGVPPTDYVLPAGEVRERYAKDGEFVMLFVGELSARKNQEFLITSLSKIKKDIPQARLWLIGEGQEKASLMEAARDYGVEDSVTFLGRRKNPADYMRDCDLYVSASKSEGLPFNIVEALGCGKPVLASRVKGHTDILDGGVGVLFDPDNTKDFVNKVSLIHSGKVTVDEMLIYEGYRNFSDATVFEDTYEKMKEASWL